ncbi:MAG: glycoside hydrolase family 2 TIM barrel-domain containing protein, partial [Planctomycetota bacterium]
RLGALEPWSPEKPKLYDMEVFIEGGAYAHRKEVCFGARHFAMDANGFRLNGLPYFVRAVLYQPYYPGTLIVPPDSEWVRREVSLIKEAGFNMVRAHIRPAPEAFLRECDEAGLLVMAEPGIGWIKKETPRMRDRVMHEVESLVMASRNHASIVMWGMLNELSGKVYPLRQELMQRTRALDPTRLITDDSAGWTGISLYMNPYGTEYGEYYDHHLYLNYPLTTTEWNTIKGLGSEGKGPVFVSEFSFGGMTDLRAAQDYFKGKGYLEDAAEYASLFDEAEQALHSTPLGHAFSSWEEMEAIADAVQSEAALVIGTALVNHPKVAGYCYTQFQDASWEISAGIVDILGKPKPAYEALKQLNATERGQRKSAPESLEPSSSAQARNEEQRGTIYGLKLQPQVEAFLEKRWKLADAENPGFVEKPAIVVSGGFLTLTKTTNVARLASLYRFVAQGGVMLYLRPPRLDNDLAMMKLGNSHEGVAIDLPVTLLYRKNVGGFIGKFHYMDPAFGLFRDFDDAPVFLGKGTGDLLPKTVHFPVDHEGVIVPIGSFDCYGQFLGGHLLAVPYGKGYFVFNHLKLLEEMNSSRLARRLLDQVIGFSFDLAVSDVSLPLDSDAPSQDQCDRISKAADELRRAFSLLERLTSNAMMGGKRKKPILLPEFYEANRMRLRAMDLLAQGEYVDAAKALEELWDGFSPDFKRFVEEDERFIRAFNDLPMIRQEDKDGKEIKKSHGEALQLFTQGQEREALELLIASFGKLN